MSHYDDFEGPSSGKEIALTPENEVLREEFLAGLEQAITSDAALTVEITDESERSGWFALPQAKYLSRIAFLKVDGLQEPGSDATPSTPFQLAVQLDAHLLDKEQAEEKPKEEIDQTGFAWPDGVKLTLLDRNYSNVATWTFCYQNAMNEFSFTGAKSGFVSSETPRQDPVGLAYGIDSGMNSGAGITEDGVDTFEEFRIINGILKSGTIDTETTDAFVGAVGQSDTAELVPSDSEVVAKSQAYFNGILKGAVTTPDFRDMLAWQQHWYGIRKG